MNAESKKIEAQFVTYAQAKAMAYATATVPCGPVSDRREPCLIAFDPKSGKTFVVTPYCFATSQIPLAMDVDESHWLAINHPNSRFQNVKRTDS